ncbi:VWA domain-containing protein [Propionicicella superfundia]|uniref:VWA domain-containing protein n=1 Tax=Propionicicella superfundia TaxID=348582 RepID=UPI0003F9453C|nr:VWA domain-containing protein [Propionicicella superfundia]
MTRAPDAVTTERARRWRLVLGRPPSEDGPVLDARDRAMDAALAALYDNEATGKPGEKDRILVGMGSSAPRVASWLGDIRKFFPSSVVQVMQADAIERLGLKRLLLEPEMMRTVTPDVHLVATLVELRALMPQQARATARAVVGQVVEEVERRLADRIRTATRGALNRTRRTSRPRPGDIDWNRTIRANLKNYQQQYNTVIAERLVGYGRRRTGFAREIVLCVDQSGSMATSVVYASIFACVLASIRALRTSLVVYDTAVVDLTDQLADPVDVIFGTQLGGGNDTPRALAYCERLVTRPSDTVLVLISDLYEGAGSEEMIGRLGALHADGVTVVVLLALDDDGKPSYDRDNAAALAALGIPCFACTPDAFPDLIATALGRADVAAWAARRDAEHASRRD